MIAKDAKDLKYIFWVWTKVNMGKFIVWKTNYSMLKHFEYLLLGNNYLLYKC